MSASIFYLLKKFENLIKKLFLILIRLYQLTLSPYIGQHCRFYPTCSCYAQEALKTQALIKALFLITRRLVHCRPFGKSGYDPVPISSSQTPHITQTHRD